MIKLVYITVFLIVLGQTVVAEESQPFLPAGQAFKLSVNVLSADRLVLSWQINEGRYLYRNKFKFISKSPAINVGRPVFPRGETKSDVFYGEMEIYRNQLTLELPLLRTNPDSTKLMLRVVYQGCSDAGICYLPERKVIAVDLPEMETTWWDKGVAFIEGWLPAMTEQDVIAESFKAYSRSTVLLVFFAFGLMLAFTPCIFPMIPILSGIIAGQGTNLSTSRAFGLSLSYVLASALAYSVFGILAGLFGSNLQLFFQRPEAVIAFSAVFIGLALSMFGVFHIQMPGFIQNRIMALSTSQQGGHWLGAAIMGMLSALAIGPCVTAPLAGALIYIGQTGDAVLGGGALFFLGLGMGLPLLVIGASAGKWLPKSGNWMEMTQYLFGLGLLAVAVWLLGRVFPPAINRWLWIGLVSIPLIYLIRRKFWLTFAAGAAIYLLFAAVYVLTDQQRDYLQSLCVAAVACERPSSLPFQKITSATELEKALAVAEANQEWLMLDIYADWCVACKEMELYTFAHPKVKEKLRKIMLLQLDVTENDAEHQALLQQFGLIGPPAVLFFAPNRQELTAHRVIGFMDSEQFLNQLNQLSDQTVTKIYEAGTCNYG